MENRKNELSDILMYFNLIDDSFRKMCNRDPRISREILINSIVKNISELKKIHTVEDTLRINSLCSYINSSNVYEYDKMYSYLEKEIPNLLNNESVIVYNYIWNNIKQSEKDQNLKKQNAKTNDELKSDIERKALEHLSNSFINDNNAVAILKLLREERNT